MCFARRYGPKKAGSIIDNCQLSDWPVRDMDKDRHLINDNAFDVFERASYGHGCEIQPIFDDKHKKRMNHMNAHQCPDNFIAISLSSLLSWLWIAGKIAVVGNQKSRLRAD